MGGGWGVARHTGAPTCCSGSSLSCIRTCFWEGHEVMMRMEGGRWKEGGHLLDARVKALCDWCYTLHGASAQGRLTHTLFLFWFNCLRMKEWSRSLTEKTVTGLQWFQTHLTLLLLLGCLSAWRMPDRWAWRQKMSSYFKRPFGFEQRRMKQTWKKAQLEFPDLFRDRFSVLQFKHKKNIISIFYIAVYAAFCLCQIMFF